MKLNTKVPTILFACIAFLLTPLLSAQEKQTNVAIFAGGCFWCMEPPFDKLDGVSATTSGYIGGSVKNPTYEQVSAGTTGHAEAVKVEYDPDKVSYKDLLKVFWCNVDPFDSGGQFCDRGDQYRSAIFYLNEEQQTQAQQSKKQLSHGAQLSAEVATEIAAATEFYPAEEYHQNYYLENPLRYKFYRFRCGRDQRLEQLWGSKQGSIDSLLQSRPLI